MNNQHALTSPFDHESILQHVAASLNRQSNFAALMMTARAGHRAVVEGLKPRKRELVRMLELVNHYHQELHQPVGPPMYQEMRKDVNNLAPTVTREALPDAIHRVLSRGLKELVNTITTARAARRMRPLVEDSDMLTSISAMRLLFAVYDRERGVAQTEDALRDLNKLLRSQQGRTLIRAVWHKKFDKTPTRTLMDWLKTAQNMSLGGGTPEQQARWAGWRSAYLAKGGYSDEILVCRRAIISTARDLRLLLDEPISEVDELVANMERAEDLDSWEPQGVSDEIREALVVLKAIILIEREAIRQLTVAETDLNSAREAMLASYGIVAANASEFFDNDFVWRIGDVDSTKLAWLQRVVHQLRHNRFGQKIKHFSEIVPAHALDAADVLHWLRTNLNHTPHRRDIQKWLTLADEHDRAARSLHDLRVACQGALDAAVNFARQVFGDGPASIIQDTQLPTHAAALVEAVIGA
jgi:hypothetical protein